ncbi:MAG: tetratricopeptide repeat protein [Flavobacterium sp.]
MKRLMTYCLLFLSVAVFAQEKKKEKDPHLPEGNKKFVKKEYASAEADYRVSGANSPTKSASAYNMGNAIYRQGAAVEAAHAYAKAIKNAKTKQQKHMAYHNMGNVFMKEKDYQNAVAAYKEALRNSPADEQTRYNYALAKKMLKDNPPKDNPSQGNSKQKEGEDKSQNPNKGDGNDNKKNSPDSDPNGQQNDQKQRPEQEKAKGNNNQPNKGGGGDDKEQKAEQGPSQQHIQNLLDAMDNEEKKVQERVNKGKVQGQPARQEKDW